ncbi:MAG: acyl--CoA ligase, partial [Firmicutes bacterium]|nr:acyl--CoA ligase [Bacillota bacterium]
MNSNTPKAPWLSSYENVPHHLDYPDISMFELIERNAVQGCYLHEKAYDFMGKNITYLEFIEDVNICAKALKAIGIKKDDVVTICMPNTPQAVTMFYALNVVGAVSNMVHPLSAEGEIENYINGSGSVAVLTMDMFYGKFDAIKENIPQVKTIICASIKEALPRVKKQVFKITKGRKIAKIPKRAGLIRYSDFMEKGREYKGEYRYNKKGDEVAVILYSGGTTGTTKGILLTNMNFNALAMQTAAAGDCIIPGHIMLSIMPIFHGFGLGVTIHTGLANGCTCVLVPQFSVDTYADILKKYRPNYIAGVPTLFEALLRSKKMKDLDLSCLEGVFSGGDSLSAELKKKVDAFLKDHNADVQIREGFGTTECVTASCLTPKNFYKEGSIGIPFPDTYYKIVEPGTDEEVPYGQDGEICISGPTVMKGYMNNPEETADTLRTHSDGRVWVHTGDLGMMDEEGFVYYKQRIKRMIISSGYSI